MPSQNVNLGEFMTWCMDHEDIPDSLDEPFVCNVVVFTEEQSYTDYEDYEAGDQIRFFLTTRRLLELSSNYKVLIQTDGTYYLEQKNHKVLLG